MKKTHLVVGILMGVILAGAAVFWGCNKEGAVRSSEPFVNTSSSEANQSPRPETIQLPAILGYSSYFGRGIIDSVSQLNVTQSYFQRFGSRGYVYSPENSYVAIGKGVVDGLPDSIEVSVVTLAMKYVADTMQQVCYISRAHCSFGSLYAPWEVSFVWRDTTEGYEQLSDGVWIRSYAIGPDNGFPRTEAHLAQADPDSWCWKCWGKCVGAGTLAGCGGAATACALAGPGWAHCAGAWCAGSGVASLIGCTLNQIW